MPGHFTLWESRSTSTPSGQLARQAAEYSYSAWAESVNGIRTATPLNTDMWTIGSSVLEEPAASILKRTGTFRGNMLLHYQETWKHSSVTKMVAVGSFETFLDRPDTVWHHITEHCVIRSHCHYSLQCK
jgi:hypothetical protein